MAHLVLTSFVTSSTDDTQSFLVGSRVGVSQKEVGVALRVRPRYAFLTQMLLSAKLEQVNCGPEEPGYTQVSIDWDAEFTKEKQLHLTWEIIFKNIKINIC